MIAEKFDPNHVQHRTASLSFRQAIGILVICFAGLWCIGIVAASINLLIRLTINPNHEKITGPFIIGSLIGILFVILIALGLFLLGIYLLRDKKGMYIRFLKN